MNESNYRFMDPFEIGPEDEEENQEQDSHLEDEEDDEYGREEDDYVPPDFGTWD